ncbi:hypothetical protein G6011_11550 [Alternaria panax]|uniref:Protein HRI1 n=1 Tax=Alternaria panax TaxID=48097 RepID=A0AAD4NQ38_9PLEO|nr:hypothetical protein G6011_11550 [Alternaria panax]
MSLDSHGCSLVLQISSSLSPTSFHAWPATVGKPTAVTVGISTFPSSKKNKTQIHKGIQEEKPTPAAQTNTTKPPRAIEVSGDISDQSSFNSGHIVFTPQPVTDTMTSLPRKKSSSPSLQMNKTTQTANSSFTITSATHGPMSTLQDLSAANISKREYIYFLPYPLPPNTEIPYSIHLPEKNPLNLPSHQFEPTSTLVLTSPNRTFVDIRIYKSFKQTDDPNQGDPKKLDWAFAGTSSSEPITLPTTGPHHGKSQKKLEEERWENVTHSTWTHWIDSRHAVGSPDIPVDEGDMYPIAPGLTLEVGHGFHPALDAVKTHEEMWRDEDIVSTSKDGSKICAVMRCQADGVGVRGVVVRLGQYCQGVMMVGEKTTVERWEWKAGVDGEGGVEEWERSVRVGDGFLPCAVAFRPEILGVGTVVKFHDFEWVVEEAWEWQ